jgi:hypothetical protein
MSIAKKEEWRFVDDGRYAVSNLGRIKRVQTGRILKAGMGGKGYRYVGIGPSSCRRQVLLHVLVAGAFFGPCPPGKEVNHKNGKKQDCCSANLEYGTHSYNQEHSYRIGLREPLKTNVKLSPSSVKRIRASYGSNGVTQRKLSHDYKVSEFAIYAVVHRLTWKDV